MYSYNYLTTDFAFCILQASPQKICSQIGLCTFDGTRGVGWGTKKNYIIFILFLRDVTNNSQCCVSAN